MFTTVYSDIRAFKALVAKADAAGVNDPAIEAAREYLKAAKVAIEILHRQVQDL